MSIQKREKRKKESSIAYLLRTHIIIIPSCSPASQGYGCMWIYIYAHEYFPYILI